MFHFTTRIFILVTGVPFMHVVTYLNDDKQFNFHSMQMWNKPNLINGREKSL